jgi:hypothetical protein
MAELGHIKIRGERKVQMVELDLDMDEQTIDKLAYIGFNEIRYDKDALVAYAFRKAFEAFAKGEKECTLQIKKSRSSKRSSRRSRSRKS